jgi:hypothetical protein
MLGPEHRPGEKATPETSLLQERTSFWRQKQNSKEALCPGCRHGLAVGPDIWGCPWAIWPCGHVKDLGSFPEGTGTPLKGITGPRGSILFAFSEDQLRCSENGFIAWLLCSNPQSHFLLFYYRIRLLGPSQKLIISS